MKYDKLIEDQLLGKKLQGSDYGFWSAENFWLESGDLPSNYENMHIQQHITVYHWLMAYAC